MTCFNAPAIPSSSFGYGRAVESVYPSECCRCPAEFDVLAMMCSALVLLPWSRPAAELKRGLPGYKAHAAAAAAAAAVLAPFMLMLAWWAWRAM